MPVKTRFIGIDYGLARIGVALSDETKLIAAPVTTIKAEKKLERNAEAILKTIEEIEKEYRCQITQIVFGLPLHMDGRVGLMADEVTQLVAILREKTGCKIATWDERLTSVQADRLLREGNLSRKKRSKAIDRVSAAIILQNYLDACERE